MMEEIKKLQAALQAKEVSTDTAPSVSEASIQAMAEEAKKLEAEEVSTNTAPSVFEAAIQAIAEETQKVEAEDRAEEISADPAPSVAEATIKPMAEESKKVEVEDRAEISANPPPSVVEAAIQAMAEATKKPNAEAISTMTTSSVAEVAIQAMAHEAKQLEVEDRAEAAAQGVGVSRMPRSLEALYLRPLKREPKYGLPVCDLQLRSYSVRPLEFFSDFALRAAYYLGLPASGPVPLPRQTQRWTVPKSHFVHKKSQENFSRTTLRRLIQIKDGHPETVQIWLAFLQKHAYYGIGMKANVWEFSKAGKLGAVLLFVMLRLGRWLTSWGDRCGQEYGCAGCRGGEGTSGQVAADGSQGHDGSQEARGVYCQGAARCLWGQVVSDIVYKYLAVYVL
jgi:ribosomal protein S10